jgi:N-acetylneuraminic acid mutarotase
MFVLEISTANETSMSELGNNWKVVSPTTAGVNTEKRENSQHAVVDNLLVLSGGFGGADVLTHIVDQTIAYDSENNSWKKYPNYFEGNINRQM